MAASHRPIIQNAYDETLVKSQIIRESEIKKINLSDLNKPVKPTDIHQRSIGNCYFLAALELVLMNYPDYLQNIVKITTNPETGNPQVEVTFHDLEDPAITYIYLLDPTRVVLGSGKNNEHTHPLIFILEKAYAAFRFSHQNIKYTDRQAEIRRELEKYKDSKKTLKALVALEETKKRELKERIQFIQKDGKVREGRYRSSLDQDIYRLLFVENKERDEVYQELHQEITEPEIQKELEEFEAFYTKNRKYDYFSALESGRPADAMNALCGSDTQRIPIETETKSESVEAIGQLLLKLKGMLISQQITPEMDETIKEIFGQYNEGFNQAKYFIQCMENADYSLIQPYINYSAMKPKPNAPSFLKDICKNILSAHPHPDPVLEKATLHKIGKYIEDHVPSKRGLNKYTTSQLKYAKIIYTAIHKGQMVSLCTGDLKPSTEAGQGYKGLAPDHAYPVVNCVMRKEGIYFVLRNPWDHYVREYEVNETTIESKKQNILKAKGKSQLKAGLVSSLFNSHSSPHLTSPDGGASKRSVPYGKEGYFEIEASDLGCFFRIDIGSAPKPAVQNREAQRAPKSTGKTG